MVGDTPAGTCVSSGPKRIVLFGSGWRGNGNGEATTQVTSKFWRGSIHELKISEGADDFNTVQSKMQGLYTKWGT